MSAGQQQVFTSWKEIASYLGKSVRTVQRWEREFALPIQRPYVKEKGNVRAYRTELDDWAARTWSQRSSKRDAAEMHAQQQFVVGESIAISRQLRVAHRAVLEQMKASLDQLKESCRQLQEAREAVRGQRIAKRAGGGR